MYRCRRSGCLAPATTVRGSPGKWGWGLRFASHINPYGAEAAMQIYRGHWTPSAQQSEPRAIVTVSAICAPTDAEADTLATSLDLAWLRLAGGRPSVFPSVAEAQAYPYSPRERMQVAETRGRVMTGAPETLRARLCALAGRTGADEIMVTTMVHGQDERLRSYELLAQAFGLPS